MHCPQLPAEQSLSHGENRLEKAAQTLGKDVTKRLVIFALYILGFNRELIAKLFGYQVAGVKTLVDRILISGLEGFYDHRKSKIVNEQASSVVIADTEKHKEISILEAVIAIPKNDILARKIISVTLAETGFLSNVEGAKILDYTPQAFGRLRDKYRLQGSSGLIDQRQGQKSDYKVTPEVKAEILFQICTKVRENTTFSSEDVSTALNECFPESKISPRTVRYHLNQLGFQHFRRKLLLKKN